MSPKVFALAGLFLLGFGSCALATPDAQTLLQRTDHARGGGLPGIVWEIQLGSREGERAEELQRLVVKAVDNASLAETLEPPRSRGARLLQVERNMWLTRPGLSKPIPISPRQRMSGQAANGDIAATNYAADYEARFDGEEALDGEACAILELSARHKRTTYDRIRYWVSHKRQVGLKAEFYSLGGKLLKTARFEYGNTINFEGRRIPFVSRMSIRDALNDSETRMDFREVRAQKVGPETFDLGQIQ